MSKSVDKNKKGLFVKRLFAFIIDMFIISLLSSLIASPFLDTKSVNKLNKDSTELLEKYQKKSISMEEFSIEYGNISYRLAREEGIVSLVTIVLIILYFVVFQLYNNGQTVGKMISKIRVVSDEGDLGINQLIFRSFIVDNLLLYIISFIFMLILKKSDYYNCLMFISCLQYIVLIVSSFMIMFRKDGKGLHDLLCRTSVVNA